MSEVFKYNHPSKEVKPEDIELIMHSVQGLGIIDIIFNELNSWVYKDVNQAEKDLIIIDAGDLPKIMKNIEESIEYKQNKETKAEGAELTNIEYIEIKHPFALRTLRVNEPKEYILSDNRLKDFAEHVITWYKQNNI